MKVAILAGGFGTRLVEETEIRPKPMVEVGGKPVLWHIMMIYSQFDHNDFAVALGYKGDFIKRWFKDYTSLSGDVSLQTGTGIIRQHNNGLPRWNIDLVDTGLRTLTGGRIKKLKPWLGGGTFMLTWGDGVADINIDRLIAFHRSHGKLATMTAVRPPARYGHIEFEGDQVRAFTEKPQTAEGWINGAFFVLEPGVLDYIGEDDVMFEHEPLKRLAVDGQLFAYKHDSFWQCMDTLREKHLLEKLWENGSAPWKTWS